MIGGYHPWFHEELKRRVVALRAERAESLISGAAAGDFADYRYAVGFGDGLNAALDIADEIRAEQEKA